MLVPINNIVKNPYRNLDLYPIKVDHVDELATSFEANGDFGTLPARLNNAGLYEIACGHHRLAAMQKLGFNEVDLKISALDDDQMIGIMIDENSKQHAWNSAATLDSVCAAMERISYITLTMEWGISPETGRDLFDSSERAFQVARGAIEAGDGIGFDILKKYLNGRVKKLQLESALAQIKGSNLYSEIIAKVKARILEEQALLYFAMQDGRMAEQEAQAARERADKTSERIEKATNGALGKKAEFPFDTRVTALLPKPSHLEAFRKAVVDKTVAPFLPLDQQYPLALRCVQWHREMDANGKLVNGELTAKSVSDFVYSSLRAAIADNNRVVRHETAQVIHHNLNLGILEDYKEIGKALNKLAVTISRLKDKYAQAGAKCPLPTRDFIERLPCAIEDLEYVEQKLKELGV